MRLKFTLTFIITLLIVATFVVAQDMGDGIEIPENYSGFEEGVIPLDNFTLDDIMENTDIINEQLQENEVALPSPVGFLFGDGNVSINISNDEGNVEGLYIEIEDDKIIRVENGFPEKSGYDIITSEETVEEILASNDSSGELISAYDNGDLKVEANGFWNNIKLFFGKIFFKIAT